MPIKQRNKFTQKSYLFLVFVLFVSCASHISKFDYIAYENAISLKVEALYLMSKATNPYKQLEPEVEQLKLDLEKAYEYSKQIPLNEITTQQWKLLKNPDKNLLGGFLKQWQEDSTLSAFYIDEKKMEISDAFDQIIELETKKIKNK